MSCLCDKKNIFRELDIAAGLDVLPRQIGGFPEFRRAMLAEIRRHDALKDWHARNEDDLGVMVLEMWAYVCDVLAFYDEAIANESYLRTADLRASLRKLTGLLGYIPRPAVAASVILTALAEGRQALTLKKGTAFRSEGFDGQSPQVFELDKQTTIHPLNNQWKLNPQRPDSLGTGKASGGAHNYILINRENTKLKKKDILLVVTSKQTCIHHVKKRSELIDDKGESYVRLDLDPALKIDKGTALADITLYTPTQTVGLWTMGKTPQAVKNSKLILDGLYRQLKADQYILVSKGGEYRWFKLNQVNDTLMDATAGSNYSVKNTDGKKVTLTVPPAQAPATELTLDVPLNQSTRKKAAAASWSNTDSSRLIVHYAFIDVGEVTRQRKTTITAGSNLVVIPAKGTSVETPADGSKPSAFVLQDVNEVSVQGNGTLNYQSGSLDFQSSGRLKSLTPPVKVFGNVLQAGRGESVSNEILGSGDAAQANQTFKLKKNPLTYVSAATSRDERGVKSTLRVWVDGVQWQEVSSFYSQGPNDEVYILRQKDDQETLITFGDGKYGRRLPTGTDNVIASYRYGAGAAAPPANTIAQLAKPVKKLTSVNNPFAASGGGDAENQDGIRSYAPQSALLLGRAVSLTDFIAAAAGMPGVQAVHAQWRWNNRRQRPVIQIWYIGGGDSKKMTTSLRNLADPSIALDVTKATAVPLNLSFHVEVDENSVDEDVLTDIRSTLTDTNKGMLSVKNIGIGQPLYRSQLFAAILSVSGTVAVTHMQCDKKPFEAMAIKPDDGAYYDVKGGALIINGKEAF